MLFQFFINTSKTIFLEQIQNSTKLSEPLELLELFELLQLLEHIKLPSTSDTATIRAIRLLFHSRFPYSRRKETRGQTC